MGRTAALLYGVVSYALFLGVFLYFVGFMAGFAVPKTINSGIEGPTSIAFVVNIVLLGLFGIQHSVMARPGFKKVWTRVVPTPVERSTYVLASNACMIALYLLWRPLPTPIWTVSHPGVQALLYGLFGVGVLVILVSTFLIDHFDLFGLRQVILYFRGMERKERPFQKPGFYKWVRHPLYVGWILSFWATPNMTLGHLLFASVTSSYILVAIVFEERDLLRHFGEAYRQYRQDTPMLIPGLRKGPSAAAPPSNRVGKPAA